MTEAVSLPGFSICMAGLAGCLSVLFELPAMHVCMTFPAFVGQSGKSLFLLHLCLDCGSAEVTVSTRGCSMLPRQSVSGLIMIESDGSPVFFAMADPTVGCRIILTTDLTSVYILMTIDTAGADAAKSPTAVLDVAIITSGGHMRPTQRKCRCIMLFQRVGRTGEWLAEGMTFLAITGRLRFDELSFVIIRMAIAAHSKPDRIRVTVRFVAFPTFHPFMHAFERISGDIVIEGGCFDPDGLK